MVCYSHLFKNFPQFVVIHTVNGIVNKAEADVFSIVSEADVDAFLEFACFLYDPANVGNLISGSSAFSKSSLYIWNFSGAFVGSVGSVQFQIVPCSSLYFFSRSIGPFR